MLLRVAILSLSGLLVSPCVLFARQERGELRVEVRDPQGATVAGDGELVSELNPRGSEYDVQFVFDGLPLTQNRSPSFAPSLNPDEIESMRVLTASYPAEYGRKLGGIVEVTTGKNPPHGLHAEFDVEGGSFSSIEASGRVSYAREKDRFSFSAQGFHTD